MTTYTTPHSMPIFETTDKIAASDDGLRQDLNEISTAAAAAISAEGGRAETAAKSYADTQAAAATTAANTYTDTKAAAATTAANTYTDTKAAAATTAANTYTDSKVATVQADVNTQGAKLNTAVFPGDTRLLDVGQVDEVWAGFVGVDDKQTALNIKQDGDLTGYAAGRVGRSLGIVNVDLDSTQKFAVVDQFDRIIISDETLAAADNALPSDNWWHVGDSMTDDAVTGTDSWVNQLAAMTGKDHQNGGWYQQTSAQIAARQGGLPALVTVPGNVTAASGATTISAILNKPVLYSTTRLVTGKLAGVQGTIREQTSGVVTFTPDVPGVYSIPPKSRFVPSRGEAYKDRIMTVWAGRNDVTYNTPIINVLASIRAMIDYLSPRVKRVIVMEVVPAKFDTADMKTYLAALNAAIKAAFPEFWLDIATYLRTQAAADAAGITFTAQDNADIAAGITPESFRLAGDSTHINALGCTAVKARLYLEAQTRGWL